ncbi:hypothetical protein N0V83_004595 [Neocucurbitaria cava]|uniref:Uncharacterized protein n=1 Tax=Neocucurbitaria cava TaxID=798079 RepID=A0A9W8YBU2_9PLEO|nr:hypothetical protein N0V83_004595 [Neocucurbitaria cava]
MPWPAFPDIPIYLEAADERATAKTYGTTPTTPTTPEIAPANLPHGGPTHLHPDHATIPQSSPIDPSPTTTIQTSSDRSIIWPIPEPPPEIQQQQPARRPTLRFFPAERPRVRLGGVPSLQIPQINEKTPINNIHPGLGIVNGPPKPPSIEISPPEKEKSDSPNIAQRIEETLWRYSASGNILKRWLLEVISWLFSAICMAAVIGVLIKLKDEPLTKWALAEKTGLTLNAYISILSKMAGAALILPVSEALGPISPETTPNGTVCGYFFNVAGGEPILMSGYIVEGADNETSFGEALMVRTFPFSDMETKAPIMNGSINFKHISNPILDALIVSASNGTNSIYERKPPVAHECVLSWCVKTIESSYDWGQYSENVTDTYMNRTILPFPWESVPVQLADNSTASVIIYNQNITIERESPRDPTSLTAVSNATYNVDNTTAADVMIIFDSIFPSYYTDHGPSGKPVLRYKDGSDGPSFRDLDFNPWLAPNNLTRHMERMATAMTNVMRSDVDSKDMLEGDAYNKENYVSVRWEWLTLPLGLLFISLIFLAATVVKSALERDRVGVWKTSAYATLLYGLPDEMTKKITRSSSTGTPRAKAKELKVKLQQHGWRVSGNLFSPFAPKPRVNQPPPGWI